KRALEHRVGLAAAALASQALGKPERAGQEYALAPLEPVAADRISAQQAVFVEGRPYRVGCANHARVVEGDEPGGGQQKQRRIGHRITERLYEYAALRIVAVGFDGLAQRLPLPDPALDSHRKRVFQELDAAVQRRPAHRLGLYEVARFAAHLPDAPVRLSPVVRRRVHQADEETLIIFVRRLAALMPAPGKLQQFSIGVQLGLVFGGVADAYRPYAAIAIEFRERIFVQAPLAADTEQDLQLIGA